MTWQETKNFTVEKDLKRRAKDALDTDVANARRAAQQAGKWRKKGSGITDNICPHCKAKLKAQGINVDDLVEREDSGDAPASA